MFFLLTNNLLSRRAGPDADSERGGQPLRAGGGQVPHRAHPRGGQAQPQDPLPPAQVSQHGGRGSRYPTFQSCSGYKIMHGNKKIFSYQSQGSDPDPHFLESLNLDPDPHLKCGSGYRTCLLISLQIQKTKLFGLFWNLVFSLLK